MDLYEVLSLVLRIAQVLVVPVLGWLVREILVNRRGIEELRSEVQRHKDKLDCLPDDKALHNLALQIEALRGDVRAMNERFGGLELVVGKMDRILDRQESFLLNGGNQK